MLFYFVIVAINGYFVVLGWLISVFSSICFILQRKLW